MPMNKKLYEELQAKRAAEHHDAERDRQRAMVRNGVACLAWAALGLVCYALAFHTTDAGMAEIAELAVKESSRMNAAEQKELVRARYGGIAAAASAAPRPAVLRLKPRAPAAAPRRDRRVLAEKALRMGY